MPGRLAPRLGMRLGGEACTVQLGLALALCSAVLSRCGAVGVAVGVRLGRGR